MTDLIITCNEVGERFISLKPSSLLSHTEMVTALVNNGMSLDTANANIDFLIDRLEAQKFTDLHPELV